MGGEADNKGGCECHSIFLHASIFLRACKPHMYTGLIVSGMCFMLIYVTKTPISHLFYIKSKARNNYCVVITKIFIYIMSMPSSKHELSSISHVIFPRGILWRFKMLGQDLHFDKFIIYIHSTLCVLTRQCFANSCTKHFIVNLAHSDYKFTFINKLIRRLRYIKILFKWNSM